VGSHSHALRPAPVRPSGFLPTSARHGALSWSTATSGLGAAHVGGESAPRRPPPGLPRACRRPTRSPAAAPVRAPHLGVSGRLDG